MSTFEPLEEDKDSLCKHCFTATRSEWNRFYRCIYIHRSDFVQRLCPDARYQNIGALANGDLNLAVLMCFDYQGFRSYWCLLNYKSI